MWLGERKGFESYSDEVLAANIINRSLKCSLCKCSREYHGTLKKRVLTFDTIPNGGQVLVEHLQRETAAKRERRFEGMDVQMEDRPEVVMKEERKGEGVPLKSGDIVRCHYDAFLKTTMEKFETSRGGRPFEYKAGSGQVIPGWEMGMKFAQKGARRRITVPPELAYRGRQVAGERNATLEYVIDVVSIDVF